MNTYIVTDKAPLKMFGKRVMVGQEFTLTEAEARYERDIGWIEEKTEVVITPKKKDEKTKD